jgi:hypothetical protein
MSPGLRRHKLAANATLFRIREKTQSKCRPWPLVYLDFEDVDCEGILPPPRPGYRYYAEHVGKVCNRRLKKPFGTTVPTGHGARRRLRAWSRVRCTQGVTMVKIDF